MKTSFKNEKGIVLVVALIMLTVLILLGTTAIMTSSSELRISANFKAGTEAFYIADAGLERAKITLNSVSDINTLLASGTLSFGSSVSFGGGAYSVVVTNNAGDPGGATTDTDKLVVATSTGTSAGGGKRVLQAVFYKPTLNPPGIRGAITANFSVGTLGTMIVDGRDHDMDGNLISSGNGMFGVSTKGDVTEGGNSKIGGTTTAGVEVAPTKSGTWGPPATGFASACERNAAWTAPLTPDQALGWPEGTLKRIAQSGFGGSQYVTNPANLTIPFSGVTFVEIPPGQDWTAVDFGESTGILVVHNNSRNAVIENTNAGRFKGVILADDYVHIHNQIIGAVVALSTNPSSGNCIGNGSGSALYSKAAVDNALNTVAFWTRVSWREVY
jgi:hypothetical protein